MSAKEPHSKAPLIPTTVHYLPASKNFSLQSTHMTVSMGYPHRATPKGDVVQLGIHRLAFCSHYSMLRVSSFSENSRGKYATNFDKYYRSDHFNYSGWMDAIL